jgi:hypothetical protein
MLLVPLLAIPLRGNSSSGTQKEVQYKQSIGEALKEALRPQELPAVDHRLFRLRLSGGLHHRAFPRLYQVISASMRVMR